MIRSNRVRVRRTATLAPSANGSEEAAAQEICSAWSCSFWTWQCGQSVAAPGVARAPTPRHASRVGARTSGRRRSRDVPTPATYEIGGAGASGGGVRGRPGAGAAEASSSSSPAAGPGASSDSAGGSAPPSRVVSRRSSPSGASSMRYHRRAETHAHSAHAPGTWDARGTPGAPGLEARARGASGSSTVPSGAAEGTGVGASTGVGADMSAAVCPPGPETRRGSSEGGSSSTPREIYLVQCDAVIPRAVCSIFRRAPGRPRAGCRAHYSTRYSSALSCRTKVRNVFFNNGRARSSSRRARLPR